jgi:hypothetical protein
MKRREQRPEGFSPYAEIDIQHNIKGFLKKQMRTNLKGTTQTPWNLRSK